MRLSLLGSTGSIGTQTLQVAKELNIQVTALAAKKNISLLEKQIREFSPAFAGVEDETAAAELKIRVADTHTKIGGGKEAVLAASAWKDADVVLNSLVGMVGLIPTVTALEADKTVALANKETLVAGGDLVMGLAARRNKKILPVDSEHSAIFQCLQGIAPNELAKITLTASGGPFFGRNTEELKNVTKQEALKHPNWDMGAKITIDSATMMNKGLEIIEAVHLFALPEDKIDVVVHRESVIHSMIECIDGSVLAQLGVPDMRLPIHYAFTWPNRAHSSVERLNLTKYGRLSFYEPDNTAFISMNLCREAIRRGGTAPAAVNAANEEAVSLFLNDKIAFYEIPMLVKSVLDIYKNTPCDSIDSVLGADKNAREMVKELIR